MRHVEELRGLESELFSKHWSSELEEQLIPQLPWPEKEYAKYSAPEGTGRNSPFLIVANLASLIEVRRGDFDFACGVKIGPVMLSSGSRMDLETGIGVADFQLARCGQHVSSKG